MARRYTFRYFGEVIDDLDSEPFFELNETSTLMVYPNFDSHLMFYNDDIEKEYKGKKTYFGSACKLQDPRVVSYFLRRTSKFVREHDKLELVDVSGIFSEVFKDKYVVNKLKQLIALLTHTTKIERIALSGDMTEIINYAIGMFKDRGDVVIEIIDYSETLTADMFGDRKTKCHIEIKNTSRDWYEYY